MYESAVRNKLPSASTLQQAIFCPSVPETLSQVLPFFRINVYVRLDDRSQLQPKHVAVNEMIQPVFCVCVCVCD